MAEGCNSKSSISFHSPLVATCFSSVVVPMKRIPSTELLDTDSGTLAEIAASLADLRMINRWFGGVATTMELTQRVARACEGQPDAGAGIARPAETSFLRPSLWRDDSLNGFARHRAPGIAPHPASDSRSFLFRLRIFRVLAKPRGQCDENRKK